MDNINSIRNNTNQFITLLVLFMGFIMEKQIEFSKDFKDKMDKIINNIDKRMNEYNQDDLRFMAVKGYEEAKEELLKDFKTEGNIFGAV